MQDIRWNIDSMFKSEEEIREAFNQLKAASEEMTELGKDPDKNLKAILDSMKNNLDLAYHLVSYTHMKQDEDSRVASSQKLNTEADQALRSFASSMSFLTPYLISLSQERKKAILEDENFSDYHLYLKKIFRYSQHTLSEKEEYILSKLNFALNSPSDIYYFLTNADIKFPSLKSLGGEKLTAENFTKYQKHQDVSVRKEAFENLYETISSYRNTIAISYYNNVRGLTTVAELKNYSSAMEMELFEDDVNLNVYNALIESIHDNFDLIHRYYAKKKELLGLKEQHMYDVYLPMIKGSQKTYSFEEARDLCIASVAPLGEGYQAIYRSAFKEGWIDVYPREGKIGGAYSSGSYRSRPFILMNFNGTLDSVFILAHEMGHSMHSYYAKKNNEFLNHSYTIFAAEVASTFNERLLLNYLKKKITDPAEKLELLDHELDSFKSTVYRQTMFAEFEKIVHERVEEGEALTSEDFNATYMDLNKKYFGPAMISDQLIANEWMRIPHFYSNFYVYKYATGYCAATALSEKVLNGDEEDLKAYLGFLKDGSKHFPIDQLKAAGVDLSNPKSIDFALSIFAERVEELERIEKL